MLDRDATRVLVVEDEPTDVMMVQRSLLRSPDAGGERFEVQHAATLAEGLERLRHDPADVLLLDLGLPDSDGLDTVVRARVRAPHLPLVVLTGSDDPLLAARTREAGADGHLVKGDLGSRILRHVLRQAIERRGADEDGLESVEVSALVRRSEPLLRTLLPEWIELRLELANGLERVRAGVEGLFGALLELVSNAVDAIGTSEGEVLLRTGSCVVDATGTPGLVAHAGFSGGAFVWLEVRDTGRGFDAASLLQERQPASRGREPGSAYGSSHLEQLLVEQGAALFVDSRLGAGATFRILLRPRPS
jgi:CheY-like chemotaxis protein